MFKFIRSTFLWIILVPYGFYGIGAAMNQACLIANHDKFPVLLNASRAAQFADQDGMIDDYHCVMTPESRLKFLGDVFTWGENSHSSIGDLLLDTGDYLDRYSMLIWLGIFLATNGVRKREEDVTIQRGN